jgi:ankyrin repeat protein
MNKQFALHAACKKNNFNDIIQLIYDGADVNEVDSAGNAPVFYALNNLPILFALIENGANVNATNAKGDSLLLATILEYNCNTLVVKYLLKKNADVNFVAKDGYTCAHNADY